MNIVLDTNVLVSGLLTPFGPSGEIVRMISAGLLTLMVDARILSEYREVLHRPKFQFNHDQINDLLDYIRLSSRIVSAVPLKKPLPDPDDEPFLEIAVSAKAACLITGNRVHFPKKSCQGVKIVSPSEFIDLYRDLE